ncbi:MAG: fluoride efflux transporter CrcB [Bacteroides sp.]|nr:fluoride efflux transporter CrcB [Bacteroides sp.]MCM1095929.1 fluoride efflux transporter CrcB [Terasakiella sp.]
MNIISIIAVGAGSCLGGIARYLVSRLLAGTAAAGAFPWSTFAVNIAGCFIIGIIYGLLARGMHLSEPVRLFLTVGFCGGFTTFSTFAHEGYLLFGGSGLPTVLLYAAASVGLGLAAVYAAYALTRLI